MGVLEAGLEVILDEILKADSEAHLTDFVAALETALGTTFKTNLQVDVKANLDAHFEANLEAD